MPLVAIVFGCGLGAAAGPGPLNLIEMPPPPMMRCDAMPGGNTMRTSARVGAGGRLKAYE